MNYQLRALQLSLTVHVLLILILFLGGSSSNQAERFLVIDFTIGDADNGIAAKKNIFQKTPAMHRQEPYNADKEPQLKISVPSLQYTENDEHQAPVISHDVQETASQNITKLEAKAGSGSHGVSDAVFMSKMVNESDGLGYSGRSHDQARSHYLKEHFAYIKEMVQKHLVYPDIARKMGWRGKVTISFIVSSSGYASDIHIMQSSSQEILDKNAVEAVKKASPFPKPPAEAKIILPILYRFR